MKQMNLAEAELLGELFAYRMAFKAAITGHPFAHLMHGRIQIAREQGVAVALGEPAPDAVQTAFERAMDEIAAMVPARAQSS